MLMDNKTSVVKYHNNLNDISIAELTAIQLNIFMAIISRISPLEYAQEGGSIVIGSAKPSATFTYDDIRALIGKTSREYSNKQLSTTIDMLYAGLSAARCMIKDGSRTIQFTLFPTYINDEAQKTLEVEVHELFRYLFSELTSHFTAFRLEEFLSLTGKHEKYLYMQIRKNRGFGRVHYDLEDYKIATGINASSSNDNIIRKIIKPAVEKIKAAVPNLNSLTCTPVKEGKEHRLTGFTLSFNPDDRTDLKLTGAVQRPQNGPCEEARSKVTQPEKEIKRKPYHGREYTENQLYEVELRKLRQSGLINE